jgi:hypothetical protein
MFRLGIGSAASITLHTDLGHSAEGGFPQAMRCCPSYHSGDVFHEDCSASFVHWSRPLRSSVLDQNQDGRVTPVSSIGACIYHLHPRHCRQSDCGSWLRTYLRSQHILGPRFAGISKIWLLQDSSAVGPILIPLIGVMVDIAFGTLFGNAQAHRDVSCICVT